MHANKSKSGQLASGLVALALAVSAGSALAVPDQPPKLGEMCRYLQSRSKRLWCHRRLARLRRASQTRRQPDRMGLCSRRQLRENRGWQSGRHQAG